MFTCIFFLVHCMYDTKYLPPWTRIKATNNPARTPKCFIYNDKSRDDLCRKSSVNYRKYSS